MKDIQIKTLNMFDEFREFIELEKIIWGFIDYFECVPDYILLAANELGGIVYGAYHNDNIVGIALILPAYKPDGGYYHYSQLLGIHPDWQHKGLGFLFKKAHYEKALSMSVKKVVWTYDPLQGPNAKLNIAKLGGIVREYKENVYGEHLGGSELISGIPSDRFVLEWYITSKRVTERMNAASPSRHQRSYLEMKPVNRISRSGESLQIMESFDLDQAAQHICIEIPENFQAIYHTDKNAAVDWRLKTRDLFKICFAAGFTVVDFFMVPSEGSHRNFYLLEKDFSLR